MKLPKKEIYLKFRHYFGTDLARYKDVNMMMLTGDFSFDIIKFDEYCSKYKGYEIERDGSLKDWITKKYGNSACQLVVDLMNFPKEDKPEIIIPEGVILK